MFDLLVKDQFIDDVGALRRDVLSKGFGEVTGTAGETYKGIQMRDPEEFRDQIEALVGFPIEVRYCLARVSYAGEKPASGIHPDLDYGEFAAIVYLTPTGAQGSGTAFFRHKQFQISALPDKQWLEDKGITEQAFIEQIVRDGEQPSLWDPIGFVGAVPGRFVTYPTKNFHARWPFVAYGETPETARMIIVIFYDRAETPAL
jgi:hypothetical protein